MASQLSYHYHRQSVNWVQSIARELVTCVSAEGEDQKPTDEFYPIPVLLHLSHCVERMLHMRPSTHRSFTHVLFEPGIFLNVVCHEIVYPLTSWFEPHTLAPDKKAGTIVKGQNLAAHA